MVRLKPLQTARIEPLIKRCSEVSPIRPELVKLPRTLHKEITITDEDGDITISTKGMLFISQPSLKYYELYQGNRVFHIDKKTGQVLMHFIMEP